MKTYKILGLLLTYPEGTVYSVSDELLETINAEAMLPRRNIKQIEKFLSMQKSVDLLECQEDYVKTFDQGRAHCLHLFEHIHGESRERGQAMVDLTEAYAARGLHINNNELPDYLPLFLEYLSHCSASESADLLGEAIDVISTIGAKLKRCESPYAAIFSAIEALSAVKPDKVKVAEAIENSCKDPETLEELDEQWQEAAAFSGDPLADCNSCNIPPKTRTTQYVKIGGVQ